MVPVLLLLLSGVAPAAAAQEPTPYQISVNVHLVVLNATVRDPKGRFAPDLREQDFKSTKTVSGRKSGCSATRTCP